MSFAILFLALLSAIIPVMIWFYILRRKDNKEINARYAVTFALSAIGGFGFTLVQSSIVDFFISHISSFFLVFLLFGIIIEYFKNYIVRIAGVGFFRTIDDVIDLSFAAALGFTFGENIVEFSITFSGNNSDVIGPVKMLKYFLIREFFVLPIHLFTSGIFGYFYGMGLFASEDLKEENKKDIFFHFFSFFFGFLSDKRKFKIVKIAQGTTLSVLFYGFFFMLYQQNPMVSDLLRWFSMPSIPIDEQLILLIAFLIFKVGTVLFFCLMDRKRRWTAQGLLLHK